MTDNRMPLPINSDGLAFGSERALIVASLIRVEGALSIPEREDLTNDQQFAVACELSNAVRILNYVELLLALYQETNDQDGSR